jgi:hypothetical protein
VGVGRVSKTGYFGRGGEFEKLVFVSVGECRQTGYCGRGGEFDKLVIVSVGQCLTNWLLWAWG